MYELTADRLTKRFGERAAVDGISVTFTRGVHGLLGENGAGKTTLMRMLCGLLAPDGGQIFCDGERVEKMGGGYRRLLGYLPQEFGYYPDYSAGRFLRYMAALKALPKRYAEDRIGEFLELVGLSGEENRKMKTFSGGMRRRIGIAQALLNDPQILILDEPTA
ncbi:MAG: ATP-binding cassette domain-containing protein [Roseburia sp.]|jgi:ABC-2 type transport system ATP-binding protein|nr:ATP-binding cassette domain-containing protein [Roseburia sp.]